MGKVFTTMLLLSLVLAVSCGPPGTARRGEEFRIDLSSDPLTVVIPVDSTTPGSRAVDSALNSSSLDAYPNPFSPVTYVTFELPAAAQARLDLYDLYGNLRLTWSRENLAAGTYNIDLNHEALATGVYFAVVTVDGQQMKPRKTLLAK